MNKDIEWAKYYVKLGKQYAWLRRVPRYIYKLFPSKWVRERCVRLDLNLKRKCLLCELKALAFIAKATTDVFGRPKR